MHSSTEEDVLTWTTACPIDEARNSLIPSLYHLALLHSIKHSTLCKQGWAVEPGNKAGQWSLGTRLGSGAWEQRWAVEPGNKATMELIALLVIHNVQGCPRFARIGGRGTWHAGGTPITPTHKRKRSNTHPQNKMATCYYMPRRPEAEANLR